MCASKEPTAPGIPTRFWATSTPAPFWHGKAHFWLNADYQSSDGYQTFSPKQDVAATAKFDYKFSDRTYLTVIGTNIILDAFNNNDPTRRQLLHYGDNYLYDNTQTNAAYASTSKYYYDPQYWRFSVYHVPSFFDIITFNHDFGKNWKLDYKNLHLRLLQPPALPEQHRPGSYHRLGADHGGRRMSKSAALTSPAGSARSRRRPVSIS